MAFPQIQTCIVCEGYRREILSKSTLLGFFGVTPFVTVRIADFALPLSLCLVFSGGQGEGTFRVGVYLVSPDGKKIPGLPDIAGTLVAGRPTSNFFMGVHSVVPGPGRYDIVLTADGQDKYKTTIELIQGDKAEMQRALLA